MITTAATPATMTHFALFRLEYRSPSSADDILGGGGGSGSCSRGGTTGMNVVCSVPGLGAAVPSGFEGATPPSADDMLGGGGGSGSCSRGGTTGMDVVCSVPGLGAAAPSGSEGATPPSADDMLGGGGGSGSCSRRHHRNGRRLLSTRTRRCGPERVRRGDATCGRRRHRFGHAPSTVPAKPCSGTEFSAALGTTVLSVSDCHCYLLVGRQYRDLAVRYPGRRILGNPGWPCREIDERPGE